MNKVKCGNDNHAWTCKEESGFLNEITTFRALDLTQAKNLKNNPNLEKTVCPKGVIACSRCGKYLNNNHPHSDLSEKLKSLKFNL